MISSNKQWGLWQLTAEFVLLKRKKEIVVSRKSRLLCCLCCTSQDCFGTLDTVLADRSLKITFFINHLCKVPLPLYWLLNIVFSSAIMAHINPEQSTVTKWRLLKIILLSRVITFSLFPHFSFNFLLVLLLPLNKSNDVIIGLQLHRIVWTTQYHADLLLRLDHRLLVQ